MVKRLAFKLTNQPPAPETGLRSNMKTSKLFHGESEAVKRDIHTAQHAPAPWRVEGKIVRGNTCRDSRKIAIATTDSQGTFTDGVGEANARLIASAPELLEMVKRFVMYYEGNETKPEGVYKIKCAKDIIERATTA